MPKSRSTASGREKAYAYLRDHILIDASMQGQFLNEQELAVRIGVSRTPVREALLLLVSDGLVELIPQRGAHIPVVTGREISELMELRGVLESHAASLTITDGSVPLQQMTETLAKQAALPTDLRSESTGEFIRLDTLFHQLLVDAAGNQLISRTYSKLHVRQILVGVQALFRTDSRQKQVCEEHQRILDALGSGDIRATQQSIEHHLEVTTNILLRS